MLRFHECVLPMCRAYSEKNLGTDLIDKLIGYYTGWLLLRTRGSDIACTQCHHFTKMGGHLTHHECLHCFVQSLIENC